VCAAASLVGLAGDAGAHLTPRLRVLHMNLCNSGYAACYTGRSVTQAAAVIRAQMPDVVTLNEVCGNDVDDLGRVLAAVHGAGTVMTAFKGVTSARTARRFSCRNGHLYGLGLLAYVPGSQQTSVSYGGLYPMQTMRGENRAWLCLSPTAEFLA